jgi:phospholipid N-methyltransferase
MTDNNNFIFSAQLLYDDDRPIYISFNHLFLSGNKFKEKLKNITNNSCSFILNEHLELIQHDLDIISGSSISVDGFKIYILHTELNSNNIQEVYSDSIILIKKLLLIGFIFSNDEYSVKFWQNPDSSNSPQTYLNGDNAHFGGCYVVSLVKEHCSDINRILEFGCSSGVTMSMLYKSLPDVYIEGIELNNESIELLRKNFPVLDQSKVYESNMVDLINRNCLPNFSYDLIVSKAAFSCLHPSVDEIFWRNISNLSRKYILTIDLINLNNERCFARDYQQIFDRYGYELIFSEVPNVEIFPGYQTNIFQL